MLIHPRSTSPAPAAPVERNSLLRAIPKEEYAHFAAAARTVPLRLSRNLIEPDQPIRFVHFPQTGMLSIVNDMRSDGSKIEVGVTGREGFSGVPLLQGIDSQPWRVMVQVAGEAARIDSETFVRLLEQMPVLTSVLHRYAAALMNQSMQQAACNRLHSLEQRFARWLLTTHDRMTGAELPLTQEFLAMMLGVRRPGVTVAAQALQGAGLISYRRGRITIADRTRLMRLSCECYTRVREDYERLLGPHMIPQGRAAEKGVAQSA